MRIFLFFPFFLLFFLQECLCELRYRKVADFKIPSEEALFSKIYVQKEKVYLADSKNVYLVNVHDASRPALEKKLSIGVKDFYVKDGNLYVLNEEGLYIIKEDFSTTKGPYAIKGTDIQVDKQYVFTVYNNHIRMQPLDSTEPVKEFYPFPNDEEGGPLYIKYVAEYPYVFIYTIPRSVIPHPPKDSRFLIVDFSISPPSVLSNTSIASLTMPGSLHSWAAAGAFFIEKYQQFVLLSDWDSLWIADIGDIKRPLIKIFPALANNEAFITQNFLYTLNTYTLGGLFSRIYIYDTNSEEIVFSINRTDVMFLAMKKESKKLYILYERSTYVGSREEGGYYLAIFDEFSQFFKVAEEKVFEFPYEHEVALLTMDDHYIYTATGISAAFRKEVDEVRGWQWKEEHRKENFVYVFDKELNLVFTSAPLPNIYCITQTKGRILFVGTEKGLYQYKIEEGNLIKLKIYTLPPTYSIHSYKDYLFLGTEKGLYQYKIEEGNLTQPKNYLLPPTYSIHSFKDYLFVGTAEDLKICRVEKELKDFSSFSGRRSYKIEICDQFAFVVLKRELHILNLSSPIHPKTVEIVYIGDKVFAFDVEVVKNSKDYLLYITSDGGERSKIRIYRFSPIPPPPIYLTGILEDNRVFLSWNTSKIIEEFIIQKSIDGMPFVDIASMDSESKSFEDREIKEGYTYRYRICAYNPCGLTYSNEVYISTHQNLEALKVYPNPWKINGAYPHIVFKNLTPTSKILLFDVTGTLVKTIEPEEIEVTDTSRAYWDLKNEWGEDIASGIYVYVVKDEQGNKRVGKVCVIK